MAKESEIRILHSTSTGATPDVSDMEYGELAINTTDDNLYYKRSASGLGTITARTPHVGFEYIYRTAGVTRGATGAINISGNTLSIHSEDNDGNDVTAFLDLVRLTPGGIVYIGDESRDKDLNVMSFLTAVTADSPDNNVYKLGGGQKFVNNVPSNGQKVRMLLTIPALEAPPPSAPTELIYEYLHGYTFSYEGTQFNMRDSETNASTLNMEFNGMWRLGAGYGILYDPPPIAGDSIANIFFNVMDRHGTDGLLFFETLQDGDRIRLENIDAALDARFGANGGVNLRGPGDIFYEFEVRANSNGDCFDRRDDDFYSWQNGDTADFYRVFVNEDRDTQTTSDIFTTVNDLSAAEDFVDALGLPDFHGGAAEVGGEPPGTYTEPPTGVKGIRFKVTRVPTSPLTRGADGRDYLRSTSEEIRRYTVTGGAPGTTGNGQLFLSFPQLGTDSAVFHKFDPNGKDNRSFFTGLQNSVSTITINRRSPAGLSGSAFAILEVGPSSYDGVNYSFDITNAITGGTNGVSGSTLGQPSITAGDEVVVKFEVKGAFNNVETLNGLTGGVTLNAGTNVTLTTAAGGITVDVPSVGSYNNHYQGASAGTYTVDPYLVQDRNVTDFFVTCSAGGGTATLRGGGKTISTIQFNATGITSSGITNPSITAGGTLEIALSDLSGLGAAIASNFSYTVGYTS